MASATNSDNLPCNKGKRNASYTDSEGLIVAKSFEDWNTFEEALWTLKLWLEKGECTEKTADSFYSLIQGACAHLNNSQQFKDYYKDRISKKRSELVQYIRNSLLMLEVYKTILNLAEEEKVLNFFNEVQRKGIKMCRASIEKCQEQFMDELDICDRSNILVDKFASSFELGGKRINASSGLEELQREKCINSSSSIEELQREKQKLKEENRMMCSQLAKIEEEKSRLQTQLSASISDYKRCRDRRNYISSVEYANRRIQKKAHLVSVISPFLYVHQDSGQTLAVILSHLEYLGFHVSKREVEDILVGNPSLFKANICSKGTDAEKRWIFCGCEH